ncbi:hypothetical protein GCM10008939_27550 [Deinococcus aquiradiocola]|uniref:Uncharacterized protein n=1 Tax=Deinococcus aquiradiocola TaxID=393059 RepID=A0A917PJV5_9DEIO|nr:hypothetical protein GCM10008939_27550 [Deinococcus aquiradiocola]
MFVLEVRHGAGFVRVHFAQSLGAAQRAASARHGHRGAWSPPESTDAGAEERVLSRLLDADGQEVARVAQVTLDPHR